MQLAEVREKARTCVKDGVALLDKKAPGWRDRVSPDILAMKCTENCVLGQVFGFYGDGLEFLDLDEDDSGSFGFDSPGCTELMVWDVGYGTYMHILTEIWRAELLGGPIEAAA